MTTGMSSSYHSGEIYSDNWPTEIQSPVVTPELGKSYLSISTNVVRPFSRGRVYANSTDPTVHPAINLNYLGINHGATSLISLFSSSHPNSYVRLPDYQRGLFFCA